jgi:hypothetical protein
MLGTFFTISADNVSTTIGYVKDLISDLMPLLLIIMAVGIGLIVFSVIVNTIRGK